MDPPRPSNLQGLSDAHWTAKLRTSSRPKTVRAGKSELRRCRSRSYRRSILDRFACVGINKSGHRKECRPLVFCLEFIREQPDRLPLAHRAFSEPGGTRESSALAPKRYSASAMTREAYRCGDALQTVIVGPMAVARKPTMGSEDYRSAKTWGLESANPQIQSPPNSLQKPSRASTDDEGRLERYATL